MARSQQQPFFLRAISPARGVIAIWMLTLPLFLVGIASTYAQVNEATLRAVVIVGVLRYTHWNPPLPDEALVICGAGDAPSFRILQSSNTAIKIKDKTLTFRDVTASNQQQGCAVLIAGEGLTNAQISAIAQHRVLTICDTCNAVEHSAIRLFMHDQRVRFAVNIPIAQKAGAQFSSAMMELAAEVIK